MILIRFSVVFCFVCLLSLSVFVVFLCVCDAFLSYYKFVFVCSVRADVLKPY